MKVSHLVDPYLFQRSTMSIRLEGAYVTLDAINLFESALDQSSNLRRLPSGRSCMR